MIPVHPDTSYSECAVMHVESMEELTGELGEVGNQSATRGYRTTEPARICGEGQISCLVLIL